ncbi:MAG: hypothetical protein CM15mP6_2240 [Methanobacteriota archaeon]|nr:MAG: hypothetical protein CM15mP6_2240 [Euryarchaeota archaeon]
MSDTTLVDGIIATKPAAAGTPERWKVSSQPLRRVQLIAQAGYTPLRHSTQCPIAAFRAFTALATPGLGPAGALSGEPDRDGTVPADNQLPGKRRRTCCRFLHREFSTAADGTVSYDCARSWDPVNGITTATTE